MKSKITRLPRQHIPKLSEEEKELNGEEEDTIQELVEGFEALTDEDEQSETTVEAFIACVRGERRVILATTSVFSHDTYEVTPVAMLLNDRDLEEYFDPDAYEQPTP